MSEIESRIYIFFIFEMKTMFFDDFVCRKEESVSLYSKIAKPDYVFRLFAAVVKMREYIFGARQKNARMPIILRILCHSQRLNSPWVSMQHAEHLTRVDNYELLIQFVEKIIIFNELCKFTLLFFGTNVAQTVKMYLVIT